MKFTTPSSRAAVLLVVGSAIGFGCTRDPISEPQVSKAHPIILISVDTLRSDRLPVYGYEGIQTPAIDSLRRDGILFERAYSHVPLTLPAHVSLLTGVLPPTHGVRDNLGYTVDPSTTPLLQQVLQDAGFATGAGVSSFVLRRATGIAAGFEFFEDRIALAAKSGSSGIQSVQRPGGATLEAVQPWLRSVADEPFFLLFHIFEPHTPYAPPAKFAARYESAYDGEVAAADSVVGMLLDELSALGIYDECLIIFLSDHGEGLGEHGETEHGLFLYRSTLQVPLIVKLPQSERAGEKIKHPVQLIDVFPTVVEVAGLPKADWLEGRSMLAPFEGETPEPIYAETFFPRLHFGWSEIKALIVGRHHFIEAPIPELYDLVTDPHELDNLIESESALEAQYRSALGEYDRDLQEPDTTDPETLRRLQALGYLGQASTSADQDLPDPKTRIEVLEKIRSAHRLYADGDLTAAAPAFAEIIAEDPGIEDAWEYLALSQLGLGRTDDAAETYRAATQQLPQSKRLALRAATFLVQIGRIDEAEALAKRGMAFDPAAAHVVLARTSFRRGDLSAAEEEARRALSFEDAHRPGAILILADVLIARGEPAAAADLLQSGVADGMTDDSVVNKLAMTCLRMGDLDRAESVLQGREQTGDPGLMLAFGKLAMARRQWSEARVWIERAALEDPDDPTISLNLGMVAMGEEKLTDAAIHLEKAVDRNPGSFDGWNALGSVRARLGDTTGAITAWEHAYAINPAVNDVIYNLGIANAQAGRLTQAASYLEDYVARAEPGPQRDHALAMAERAREAGNR